MTETALYPIAEVRGLYRAPQYPATRDAGEAVTVCQRACRCGPDGCSASDCAGKA